MKTSEIFLLISLILTFLGSIFSIAKIWLDVKVKLKEIEVSTELKIDHYSKQFQLQIESIKSNAKGVSDFLGTRISEIMKENKDDHNEIKNDVKIITKGIHELNIKVAERIK